MISQAEPYNIARGTRSGAVARAQAYLDDGRYLDALSRLVAVRTESQNPDRAGDLWRYLEQTVGPILQELGFSLTIFENPSGAGPILLANLKVDPDRPTVLIYGHGDVVRGQDAQWREGLDPWVVKVEGDRIYGRGTADNKGQHLVAIEALRAVIAERGALGFNAKFLIECGEELGSPGIRDFLSQNIEACSADVFIGLDGPRQSTVIPEIRLGARGGATFDLVVNLRESSHHSGHWGGVLADAGFILAHALASIITPKGEILVEDWKPDGIPQPVRRVCADIQFESLPNLPQIDQDWGEPGLSRAEKIFAWTSVTVLSFITGRPEAPVNAVQGEARARLQVRYDTSVASEMIIPSLRAHLNAHGLDRVQIIEIPDRISFPASRTDPGDPWVQKVAASIARTSQRTINIVPNSSGGNPSAHFKEVLGTPVLWIPQSYAGSSQHAPNEHALMPVIRQGLGVMAGLWWDLCESEPHASSPPYQQS